MISNYFFRIWIHSTCRIYSDPPELCRIFSLKFPLICVSPLCLAVKAALLLGLFGGTARSLTPAAEFTVRGDPHILLVGDPGLGKSQLLNAVAGVAPR